MDQAISSGPAGINLILIYGYLTLAFIISSYLVMKSKTVHKFELFVIIFFLMSGSYNELLKLRIPGFDLHLERILYFTCIFFLVRRFFSSGSRMRNTSGKQPVFLLLFYFLVGSVIISQLTHINEIDLADMVVRIFNHLSIICVFFVASMIVDKEVLKTIGKAIIIGAVFSAVISLIQIGVDQMFMRIGDNRPAFGSLLRSNGIFDGEYINSYFLIIASYWVLVSVKNNFLRNILVGLFFAGVISTFQRMSWVVLALTMLIYFWRIAPPRLDRLIFTGLMGLAVFLTVFLFSYRDIMNSTLVKERLSDSVKGRKGYWEMVLTNIGDKPLFGFGDKNNEVYYHNMLLVTHNRDRATGDAGDIHNGYLQIMFFFGIPSSLLFLLMVVMSVLYYKGLVGHHLFFTIPCLVAILFLIANLTNNFSFTKQLSIFYMIHMGLGHGVRHLDGFITQAIRPHNGNLDIELEKKLLANENN